MVCISMKAVMLRKAMPATVNCCARCEKRPMLPEIALAAPLGRKASWISNSSRFNRRLRYGTASATATTTVASGTSANSVVNASAELVCIMFSATETPEYRPRHTGFRLRAPIAGVSLHGAV